MWELIVTEALAQLGPIIPEDLSGGPDVRLELPTGRNVWVEISYLHPRFESQDRLADVVTGWLQDEVSRRFGDTATIGVQFFSSKRTTAGHVLKLPRENERRAFLGHAHIAALLARYASDPTRVYTATLQDYSVRLTLGRAGAKAFFSNGGRPLLEAPWRIDAHGLFRKLREKRSQHKVTGPRVLCIGSDTSPVINEVVQALGHSSVLSAGLGGHTDISAVIVAEVAYRPESYRPTAQWKLHLVRDASEPLAEDEVAHLLRMDLNRWRYTSPLVRDNRGNKPHGRSVSAPMSRSIDREGRVKLKVPVPVLLDALAGRRNLKEATAIEHVNPDPFGLDKLLSGTHTITACEVVPGDQREGRSATVILEFGPSHDLVYWADDGSDDRTA